MTIFYFHFFDYDLDLNVCNFLNNSLTFINFKLKQLENFIKNQYYSEKSPIHQLYVTRFNAVDLSDCYYSKANDSLECMIGIKSSYGLLKLATVNVYIRSIKREYHDWINFRRNLANSLIKYDQK